MMKKLGLLADKRMAIYLLGAVFLFLLVFAPVAGEESEAVVESEQSEEEVAETSMEAGQTLKVLGRVLGKVFFPRVDYPEVEDELSPLLGLPAPKIELETVAGELWRLEDHRGSVVVLDFWATWCGPCVAAMPQLQQLHESLEDNVVVVGVNQGESAEEVDRFSEEKKITFALVLDTEESVGSRYAVSGIPQTVVIDGAGIVQAVHVGFSPYLAARLEKQIARILKGENLFDEEQLEKAREKRMKEVQKIHQVLGEVHPERLIVVNEIKVEGKPNLRGSTPSSWLTLPTTGERVLGLNAGGNQILFVQPATNEAQLIPIFWEDDFSTWELCATQSEGQLQWAATSYAYNDQYEVEVRVALFDRSGKSLWAKEVPMPGEFPSFSLEAGDFDADGRAEVVIIGDYSALDFGPEYVDVSRVVSVWDDDGTLVARKWVSGRGGTGVYVLSDENGSTFLMQGESSFQRIRLAEGQP